MTERYPLIFDVKRTSTVDGPGVRTAVFLKGCNLDCFWCHNPEGKRAEMEYAWFAEKCLSCGACRREGLSPELCVDLCPAQARKRYGARYTPDELMAVLAADRDFYLATGGGVTFSGGECMLYPAYLAEVASRCQAQGISVAIDTAGNVPYSHFEQVLPYTDLFLYDIKCLDPALHRRGTGCGNELILANLDRLMQTGKQTLIRVPQIPDFNEGEEVTRICAYCADRGLACEVLPYHRFGEDKKQALGREMLHE